MRRRLSLPRLALIRLRRRWALALVLGLGLTAAVALGSLVPLLESVTSQIGLQLILRELKDERFILLTQKNTDDEARYKSFQGTARAATRETLGKLVIPGAQYVASDDFFQRTINGQTISVERGEPNPHLASYEDLGRHIDVVTGAFPTEDRSDDAWWVMTSELGARNLHLHVGDRYCMTVFGELEQGWCARVAGIWRQRDPAEGYWGGFISHRAVLTVGQKQFFAILAALPSAHASAFAVYEPDRPTFRQDEAQGTLERINRLRGFFSVRRGDTAMFTGLDRAIGAFLRRLQLTAFAVQLVAVQLLVIALYFVAFAAGHALEQQRQIFAVWRSRGWSGWRTWRLLMLEFVMLAMLAVPAGLLAGAAATAGVAQFVYGRSAPLGARPSPQRLLIPVALSLLAGLVVLALQALVASRKGLLEVRRHASRPAVRGWWQWRYVDLLLVALALPLLGEVRLRGSSELRGVLGAQSADPVTLVLPGVVVGLVALAALRLLPALVSVARLVRRDLPGTLASWQLARQPVQHARLALLLIFAVATGLFASIYATTERRNATDRVGYATGADVRVAFKSSGATPPVEEAIRGLKNIDAYSLVFRAQGQPGSSSKEITVLGIDPASFAGVGWSRPDLSGEPEDEAMRRLSSEEGGGMLLPGGPVKIGLWVYSSGLGVELSAPLTEAGSGVCACVLGRLDFTGWRYLETDVQFTQGGPRYPMRLRELLLRYAGPGASKGTVALSDLGVVVPGSTSPLVVEPFIAPTGWTRTVAGSSQSEGELRAGAKLAREGLLVTELSIDTRTGPVRLVPTGSDQPVNALASERTLKRLGLGLGERFPVRISSDVVTLVVVGRAEHFPTLYPEEDDYLVAVRDPLLARLGLLGSARAWANEAWLKVKGPAARDAVQSLRARPDVAEVQDRAVLEALALSDPVRLGLQSMLIVGFVAALALAVGGFALHFFITTRGRLSEYAILQANGLSSGQIQRSLGLEQVVLLAFTLVAGTAIGAALAWTMLPVLQLGAELRDTVPANIVTVDPLRAAAAAAAVAVGAAVVGRVATRLGRRFQLMDELRTLG